MGNFNDKEWTNVEAKWDLNPKDHCHMDPTKHHECMFDSRKEYQSPHYGDGTVDFQMSLKNGTFTVTFSSPDKVQFYCICALEDEEGIRSSIVSLCSSMSHYPPVSKYTTEVPTAALRELEDVPPELRIIHVGLGYQFDWPLRGGLGNPLPSALQTALDNGFLSDCTLKVGDRHICAHRCVLAAHSEIFLAMFTGRLAGGDKGNEIVIGNTTGDAVQAMLEYLYGGVVTEGIKQNAFEVYKLAQKYKILRLEALCLNVLESRIVEQDVFQLVKHAYVTSSESLMLLCAKFVKSFSAFLKSEDWKQFKAKNLKAAFQLCETIAKM